METYFTIEELAKYLKYAEKTIRKWVLDKEIPFIKIHQSIRFRLSEIEKWVDENRDRLCVSNAAVGEGNLFSEPETELVNDTAETGGVE